VKYKTGRFCHADEGSICSKPDSSFVGMTLGLNVNLHCY